MAKWAPGPGMQMSDSPVTPDSARMPVTRQPNQLVGCLRNARPVTDYDPPSGQFRATRRQPAYVMLFSLAVPCALRVGWRWRLPTCNPARRGGCQKATTGACKNSAATTDSSPSSWSLLLAGTRREAPHNRQNRLLRSLALCCRWIPIGCRRPFSCVASTPQGIFALHPIRKLPS